jgi:hypothetical protein
MSAIDLNALERDVERSRQKLASDLARLRSSDTLASFKDILWEEARNAKVEVIEKTTEAAKDTAQRLFYDLKERAIANPAATLAIGAGLAWRLARQPPIATLLVGIGLASLLRTSPSQQTPQRYPGSLRDDAGALPQSGMVGARHAAPLRTRVHELSEAAGAAIRQSMTQVADKAASVTERASEVLQETSAAARETAGQVAEKTSLLAERASEAVRDISPDQDVRNKFLLGAATLAVTAAVGIAYQRRAHDHNQAVEG